MPVRKVVRVLFPDPLPKAIAPVALEIPGIPLELSRAIARSYLDELHIIASMDCFLYRGTVLAVIATPEQTIRVVKCMQCKFGYAYEVLNFISRCQGEIEVEFGRRGEVHSLDFELSCSMLAENYKANAHRVIIECEGISFEGAMCIRSGLACSAHMEVKCLMQLVNYLTE